MLPQAPTALAAGIEQGTAGQGHRSRPLQSQPRDACKGLRSALQAQHCFEPQAEYHLGPGHHLHTNAQRMALTYPLS
jgi:hypothetical protein